MKSSSLSGDTIYQFLYQKFKKVRDHRNPLWIEYPLSDFFMSALAIFSLKFPSLLKFEEAMREKTGVSNMPTLFKVSRVPSDTQMRTVLDEVDPEGLRPMFSSRFARAQRSKALEDFKYINNSYLIPVDGAIIFLQVKFTVSLAWSPDSEAKMRMRRKMRMSDYPIATRCSQPRLCIRGWTR